MHSVFREHRRIFAEPLARRRDGLSGRPIVAKRANDFADMTFGNSQCFAALYDGIPGVPLVAQADNRVAPGKRGSVDPNELLRIKLLDEFGEARVHQP